MKRRKSNVLVLGILFMSVNGMTQYETANRVEESKTFPWPEGKRCAVSLTFDDARLSQVDAGIPLLNRYGFKATFYISPKSCERSIEGWKAAAEAGQRGAEKVGEVVSVHVIPRPHVNVDIALPLGRSKEARAEMGGK